VAVLIDATLIRGVLLPAAMKLLGDWNWCFPRRLEWLPKLNVEAGAARGGGVRREAGCRRLEGHQEPEAGLEPTTHALQERCSTS
jgi:hypothetical protein